VANCSWRITSHTAAHDYLRESGESFDPERAYQVFQNNTGLGASQAMQPMRFYPYGNRQEISTNRYWGGAMAGPVYYSDLLQWPQCPARVLRTVKYGL